METRALRTAASPPPALQQDIRRRKVLDREGNEASRIDDLLIDLDQKRGTAPASLSTAACSASVLRPCSSRSKQ